MRKDITNTLGKGLNSSLISLVISAILILGSISVASALDPYGYVDGANCDFVGGWARDDDTTGAISVHLYFDGNGAYGTTANIFRSGVGNHAFHYVYSNAVQEIICDGSSGHYVNAYGINVGPGSNTELTQSPFTISGSCGYFVEPVLANDAPSSFADGTSDCCPNSNECVVGGACTSYGSTTGTVPNRALCGSPGSSWYGGDHNSLVCEQVQAGGILTAKPGHHPTTGAAVTITMNTG
jgi:hypothetical protein